MRFNLKLRISHKLPAFIAGAALVTGLAIGVANYVNAAKEVETGAMTKLEALMEGRRSALTDYLATIEQDLRFQASNPTVIEALASFKAAWAEVGGNPTKELQRLYIDENPHPTGQKENLDLADDGSTYSSVHGRYHPWFRQFLRERSYYDIFLFDLEGNLVYTVFKELDYATNLMTGQWKDSDLGNVFRAARDNAASGVLAFFDFRPYAPSHGAPASFIAKAVRDAEGKVAGVLAFQMPIDRINAVMQISAGMGESGEAYIVGSDNLMRSDSRFSEESTILKTKVKGETVRLALEGQSGVQEVLDYRGVPVLSAYGPVAFHGTNFAVLAEVDVEEALAGVVSMRNISLVIGAIVLVVVGLIGVLLARSVARPIALMTGAMGRLAEGDKSVEIPAQDRTDEIGEMAQAVQVFKDNAIRMEELAKEQAEAERQAAEAKEKAAEEERRREAERLEAERQAEEEKRAAEQRVQEEKAEAERQKAEEAAERQRKAEERAKRLEALIQGFDSQVSSALETVSSAATQMQTTAQSMSATAEESSRQSTAVATASEQASSNVQTVATAAEELSTSIAEISNQVAQSAKIAEEAVREAERTNSTVQGLAEAAGKIGDVVGLINDIAGQTNLLALNATIEAARAGEAGKGFAVVASEVKNLANQTAKATSEISGQIGDIQAATEGAVGAIQGIGATIAKINDIASSIASAVEEQGAATSQISRNVQEAAKGTQEVTDNITAVTQAAVETGSAANQVLGTAEEMAQQSTTLREQVESFLTQIRAA